MTPPLLDALRELSVKWRADSLTLGESDGYGAQLDRCADELDAALSAQGQDGWVLVPREPTPEMIDAADKMADELPLSDWGKIVHATPGRVYAAMIAAAPPTGTKESE